MVENEIIGPDADLGNLPTKSPEDAGIEKPFIAPAVRELINAFNAREQLNESLTACLEQFKSDFDRGIVRIDASGTLESYAAALKADKTAGQTWEGENGLENKLRTYLLANNAAKLHLAVAMPGGPCLIGVYENGEPAIRQRDLDITNVLVVGLGTKREEPKLELLPHAKAMQRFASTGNLSAKPVEIVRGVEEAGYRVPADLLSYKKEGLIAASEAVMGGNYVESPVTNDPKKRELRSAMLRCPRETPDDGEVRIVQFIPDDRQTHVYDASARFRFTDQGAVLWL